MWVGVSMEILSKWLQTALELAFTHSGPTTGYSAIISAALQKVQPPNPELQNEPTHLLKVQIPGPHPRCTESNFQVLGLEICFYRVFTFLTVL